MQRAISRRRACFKLSSDDFLENILVQIQVSYHALQSRILIFELAQPPEFTGAKFAILLPDVKGGYACSPCLDIHPQRLSLLRHGSIHRLSVLPCTPTSLSVLLLFLKELKATLL